MKKTGQKKYYNETFLSGLSHTPQYDFSFFARQYIQVVIVVFFSLCLDH